MNPLIVAQVQALREDSQHAPHVRLLEIFTYGTLQHYTAEQEALPPLSDAQLMKLRHLTVVQMAKESRTLSYASLFRLLQLQDCTDRQLEDTIIEGIYRGLYKGKVRRYRATKNNDVYTCTESYS